MTAERPEGDRLLSGAGLPASPSSPPQGTPAVTLCSGYYIKNAQQFLAGYIYADCDVCGSTGQAGERCQQTVIA